MSEFLDFLGRLVSHLGLTISVNQLAERTTDEYELAAAVLNEINAFLYQTHATLDQKYMSEFHKYWKSNHERILRPRIGRTEVRKVARVLEEIYASHTIRVQHNTLRLSPRKIANVRFFTAIQDFKIDISAQINPFELYRIKPGFFDAAQIVRNDLLIDEFLNRIGAESQRDKRKPWMRESARLLLSTYDGSAFNINERHHGDVLAIKSALTSAGKYGFSEKKADMFLRDMADLGVWTYRANMDQINVMSDKNTMRVALRTGIVQFRIPLLASYLDVYCHQYALVDRWCVKAWREVWNVWNTIPGNHRPCTPASIDYIIYRLGKLACGPSVSRRKCPPSKPIAKNKYEALISQDQLIFGGDRYCIFSGVC